MLSILNLLKEELRREWILRKRYWANLLSMAITIYVLFLFVVMAGSAMGAGAVMPAEGKASALVGIMMWTLSMGSVGVLGWSFFNEAATGTLEHLYLSPLGPQRIFLARSVADFITSLVTMAFATVLAMVTTGVRLDLPVLELAVILPLSVIGVYGFGFLLAALTLTVKRTQSVMQLVQFFFLFFTGAMVPLENMHPAIRYFGETLPMSAGVRAARAVTIEGATLVDVSGHLLHALVTSLVWLALGLAVYTLADRRARLKGSIGQY